MATHLDLEEQEQLDQLKHFWATWGNLITWAVLLVAGAFIAWNGWQYLQRSKAAQAAALYDEIERNVQAGEVTRVQSSFTLMKDKFGGTTWAEQGALLTAKLLGEKGDSAGARAALAWVAAKGNDAGYQAIARLRLAGELLNEKKYDEALKQLDGAVPKPFEALVSDRRGDILLAQGQRDGAREAYLKALAALDASSPYRRLVEVKLNAAGGTPPAIASANTAPMQDKVSQ